MNTLKRVMGLVLSAVLMASLFPISALAESETDELSAESSIAINLDDIDHASQGNAVLLGTAPSSVIVKDGLTRAEWMKDLVLIFGMSITADEYPDIYFPDISESTEYFAEIMTAVKYGVVSIEAGDNFEPDTVLTREFAAQTLNACLGMQKTSATYTYGDTGSVEYQDDAQVAVDLGWFALVDGDFAPSQQVTADEITAMVNSVQSVLDERVVGNGTANYQFADYVKVIPDTAEIDSSIDFEVESTTVSISNWDDTLAVGDTFAFFAEDYAFVYGVKQVVEDDGVINVITTDAPAGAILNYDYAGELDLELSPDLRNNEAIMLMSADGDPVYFDEIQLLSSSKQSISFSRDFIKGNGLGITGKIKGTVKDLRLDTKFVGGNKHFILSGKIDVTSTMELDLLDDPAAAALQLGGISLGPFGYAGIEINLKMEAKIGYTLSSEFRIGLDYQNGNKSWIKELNTKESCLTAEGTVSAQIALAAHLEFGANGSASISLGAGPRLEGKLKKYSSGSPTTCITLAGYLHAGFEVKVKFKEIFTSQVILDYKYSYDFYNEKNSPIRVCTHVEDGVEVHECTRGKDAGTADSGYKTPKYVSPANSKYVAGGSNVSSSGYGGYGSTTPVVIWTTSDNDDGTVTITGYKGSAPVLNIPETIDGKAVTKIGDAVFENNTTLRIVYIPDTVTSIGNSAFYQCNNLKTVSFGENLAEIQPYAFAYCTSLEKAELPEGLTNLGYHDVWSSSAFLECTSLKEVYIPSTIETASLGGPFNGCSSLDTVVFGEGISTIVSNLFEYCTGLTHIEIPDTVTSISDSAFYNCTGLTHIEIPDTVTSIGNSAFYQCNNLKTVSFGENLTEIQPYAFAYCTSLEKAELPEGLTNLGYHDVWSSSAFLECTSLKEVYIPSTIETASLGGPFNGCSSLDTVVFGEGISTIVSNLFEYCTGLTHIEIPNTVSIIGDSAFLECENLASVTIPDSVTTIGSNAFSNSGLTSISIPDTITEYRSGILQNCTNLKTAKLSANALDIPYSMFSGCTSLESISIPDGVTEIKSRTFFNCESLSSLNLPDSITSIESEAFKGCTALTNLTWLPYSVVSIGFSAFEGCISLAQAELPDFVSNLGDSAFKGCTSLTAFKASNDLLTIGLNCFQDCSKLTDVSLNDGLIEIRSYAFQNCASLETIIIPDSVIWMGDYAFQKDAKLVNVTLSAGLKEIPAYAFANCTSMTELVIPNGVTTIAANAFYQDTKLKTFTIPASVTSIGSNAFSYPTTTTIYGVAGSYAQTFAKWKSFVDVTKASTGIALANGTNSMTIESWQYVTPRFTLSPADSTDVVVSLSSDNTDIVSIVNGIQMFAYQYGTANVTATTFSGRSYTFVVTVDSLSDIEITHQPNTTEYGLKEGKDVSGLVVSAVFSNGSKEPIYDYTLSGFTTDTLGTHTVTAHYEYMTASFPITVSKTVNGTLGERNELRWTYSGNTGQVTITGAVSTAEPVYVAIYNENGQMTGVTTITLSGGKAEVGSSFHSVKLIWVDATAAPKCANAEIIVSE